MARSLPPFPLPEQVKHPLHTPRPNVRAGGGQLAEYIVKHAQAQGAYRTETIPDEATVQPTAIPTFQKRPNLLSPVQLYKD